jgi:hypothetical protein
MISAIAAVIGTARLAQTLKQRFMMHIPGECL